MVVDDAPPMQPTTRHPSAKARITATSKEMKGLCLKPSPYWLAAAVVAVVLGVAAGVVVAVVDD